MNRYALLAACSVALTLASACDDESKPALTTSTSSGAGGSTSGTGGASSSGSGGSTSGGGGASSSGSGGSSSSGTGGSSSTSTGAGGGQGECNTCSEFFAECFSNGCPNKATVCYGSIQIWDAAFFCICQQCASECDYTCTGSTQDQTSCPTCMQTAISGTCAAQMATCNADTD